MILLFLITIYLLIPNNLVFAGIMGYGGYDTAMTIDKTIAVYSIPEFYTKKEAEAWGYDMKGIEPIRRLLGHRMESLLRAAHLDEADSLDLHRVERAGKIMKQHSFCEVAMNILKMYKENGKNDHAMTTYRPYKIKPLINAQDALRLADKIKWNDDIMITIRDLRSRLLEQTAFNSSYNPETEKMRVRFLMLQWEWFGIALDTMQRWKDHGIHGEDAAQVGSSMYAGSIPMNKGIIWNRLSHYRL